MKLPEIDDLERRFDEAWKQYAGQPPRQSPADAAAKVALQIRQRLARSRPSWVLAAAAAVLLVAVGSTVLWKPVRTPPPSQPTSLQETVPLGKGEVLIWIDDQTPLYMTFQAPDEEQEKGGKS